MIWDDDWELVIDGWEGSTVLSPENEIVVLELSVTEALNYTRTERAVVGDDDAVAGDQFKMLELDATSGPVNFTIDPSLFTGLTLEIRCKNATYDCKVIADSGVIELKTGEDLTEVGLMTRQTLTLYSNGTNLKER